jgi:hypothetical protein
MCYSGRGLVVGSNVLFWYGFIGTQLFAFLVGVFRQLCSFLERVWW